MPARTPLTADYLYGFVRGLLPRLTPGGLTFYQEFARVDAYGMIELVFEREAIMLVANPPELRGTRAEGQCAGELLAVVVNHQEGRHRVADAAADFNAARWTVKRIRL